MSNIIESLRHELNELNRAGVLSQAALHEFDTLCPPPVREFSPADIRQLREHLQCSQPLFARHLHTTASTVRKWERGATHPSGPALKLLNIIADKGLSAIL